MIFYRMDFVKSVVLVMTEQGLRPSRYLTPIPKNGLTLNAQFLQILRQRLSNFRQRLTAFVELREVTNIYTDGALSVVTIGRNKP
jgi:hypothetical protein